MRIRVQKSAISLSVLASFFSALPFAWAISMFLSLNQESSFLDISSMVLARVGHADRVSDSYFGTNLSDQASTALPSSKAYAVPYVADIVQGDSEGQFVLGPTRLPDWARQMHSASAARSKSSVPSKTRRTTTDPAPFIAVPSDSAEGDNNVKLIMKLQDRIQRQGAQIAQQRAQIEGLTRRIDMAMEELKSNAAAAQSNTSRNSIITIVISLATSVFIGLGFLVNFLGHRRETAKYREMLKLRADGDGAQIA